MATPPPIKIPDISSAAVASAAAGASKAAVSSKAASAITGHRTEAGSILNLTVNGAIDSEGTARTIVNTLNDSYFRGTGGGNQLVLTQ
jgi:hypothetical protein